MLKLPKVLVVATSRKTRGGITSVIKAHEHGKQWGRFHCYWIQTHRDGNVWVKLRYLIAAWVQFLILVPFCQLVHIHGTAGFSAKRKQPFIKIAKFLDKKVIFHFHPSSDKILSENKNKIILNEIFSTVDRVIVLSPSWVRLINCTFPNNVFSLQVLWNPCPKVNRCINTRKKQILFAATIIERKGYITLLQAFGKIAPLFPDWKLVCAGNGDIKHGKQVASELCIDNQVEWLGWITGDLKEKVFQESSIYCLASKGEGFPMSILDAWAYGIPCVMTPVGGLPDIVKDGENGLLFPIGDSDTLAEKLSFLMRNEDVRKTLVVGADKWVYGDLSEENITHKLEQIYVSLMKNEAINDESSSK